MDEGSSEDKMLLCPVAGCMRSFTTQRGLTRHKTETHPDLGAAQATVPAHQVPAERSLDEEAGTSKGTGSKRKARSQPTHLSMPQKRRTETYQMPDQQDTAAVGEAERAASSKQSRKKVLMPRKGKSKGEKRREQEHSGSVGGHDVEISDSDSEEKVDAQSGKDLKNVKESGGVDSDSSIHDQVQCGETPNDSSGKADPTELDDSTKLLINLAKSAFENQEIMADDDREVLEWLIDSENTQSFEDVLLERLSSVPSSSDTGANIEVETDNLMDTVVSDIAIEDDVFIVGSQSPVAPDEEEFISEGFDNDYIILTETNEDPFHWDPILAEPPSDPDSWEYELAKELVDQISEEWLVTIKNGLVKLMLLSPFENGCVERCISWNGSEAKVFVNNKKLSDSSLVKDVPALKSQSDAAFYLARLVHLVGNSMICKGIRMYSDQWTKAIEKEEVYKEEEFYQDVLCLRDNKCPLLVTSSVICHSCHHRQETLKHRSWRAKRQEGKDSSKTNVRYLSNEEQQEKLRKLIEDIKRLRKKAFNLQVSLQKFVKTGTVEVGTELAKDFTKIFKENKLTSIQRLFWGQQVKALSKQKDLRGMRWNPFMIRLALRIQMLCGSQAYDSLRQVIFLPSQRTLFDFSHFVDSKEGPQDAILDDIEKELKTKYTKEHEKYFNLLLDEMDIRSNIVIDRRTGEVIGFLNLLPVEEEMEKLEAEMMEGKDFIPQPAKKILVFMVQGVCNGIKEVVGIYTTSGAMTAAQLYSRCWKIIYHCESRTVKILCVICDGASVNKKFISMHAKFKDPDLNENEHPPEEEFVFCTRNLACPDEWRPLFFIIDPPHLLKTIRNCLANSYCHKKTRKMWKNGEDISWATIEALYAIAMKNKFTGTKLTRSHIKLTSHSCMKVVYATQVMSRSVLRALEIFKSHSKLKNIPTAELKKMIELVNDWFDCLNGGEDFESKRYQENKNLKKYEDTKDERFDFLVSGVLGFFNDWKEDTLRRQGKFSGDAREKMFISTQSYESLKITIYGFTWAVKYMLRIGAPYVIATKFNQDSLEQYFGKLRMAFGCNKNPSASQVIKKTLTLHQQKEVALSSKTGNTEVLSQDYVPNEEKMRRRKK